MKNIVYIATLFLIIAGLSGCEKESRISTERKEFISMYNGEWIGMTRLIGPPSLILKLNLLKGCR